MENWDNQTWTGVILVAGIVVLVVLLLARKGPFLVIGRLMRPFWRLIRAFVVALLRAARLMPKTAKGGVLESGVWANALSALWRVFKSETATDQALSQVDLSYEKEHVGYRGFLFRWMHISPKYVAERPILNEERAKQNEKRARTFYDQKVPIFAPPHNLYEDNEGAFIINMFKYGEPEPIDNEVTDTDDVEAEGAEAEVTKPKWVKIDGFKVKRKESGLLSADGTDAGCFYLLNQYRKVINGNVFVLTTLFSLVVVLVFLVNMYFYDVIDFTAMFRMINKDGNLRVNIFYLNSMPVEETVGLINQWIFAIITTLIGIVIMIQFYYIEYVRFQTNNSREFNNFITRYLAWINDHLKKATADAKGATVGEKTAEEVRYQSQLWFINVEWLSMRAFFIECFTRNVVFQIQRNSSYYLFFVPAFVFLVTGLLIFALTSGNEVLYDRTIGNLTIVFLVVFAGMFYMYVRLLGEATMHIMDYIDQDEWIGWDDIEVQDVIEDVVGNYGHEVGYWKNRVGM